MGTPCTYFKGFRRSSRFDMHFYCKSCGKIYTVSGLAYKCECGDVFNLKKEHSDIFEEDVSLGETKTPIVRRRISDLELFLKLDSLLPTGSFKDRGAKALISMLKSLGIKEVVEDSSGNAGAAVAAYCAAAGIKCHIFLPENASYGKVRQIGAYGAVLHKIPGDREETSRKAAEMAERMYYASHFYNPVFFEGTKTIVSEIIAETGVPDYVFSPVGHGTMLLGLYYGFKESGRLPKIIGVQSKHCCPVYRKQRNLAETANQPTVAEGIAVANPPRADQIIEAVNESGGDIIVVDDCDVMRTKDLLGLSGIYVEPTAAVAPAGALKYFGNSIPEKAKIVVPITGTGLKA